MGVKQCDRLDCKNIMCDNLVQEQYICYNCSTEFQELVGDEPITKKEMILKFNEFMNSSKICEEPNEKINVNNFLNIRDW